ncbi:MAG: hypothetical protein AAF493_14285 [Pseudomonadota bacterium]
MNDNESKRWLDEPANIKKILWVFYALCAVLVLVEFFHHRHVTHAWESLFGFYAIYGFVACVILVLAATQLRKWLMRDEDYYDRD